MSVGPSGLSVDDARSLLQVSVDATPDELRAAYRRQLLRTHPDHSRADDATTRTILLRSAYELLLAAPVEQVEPVEQPEHNEQAEHDEAAIRLVDRDTIGVDAPPSETLMLVLDAAHRLGEVSYLDPSAGLVEIVVEFADAPTSSLVLSLQGRATGTTEVFCTVEPLSGGESPPVEAVTRLLLRTLRGEDPTA